MTELIPIQPSNAASNLAAMQAAKVAGDVGRAKASNAAAITSLNQGKLALEGQKFGLEQRKFAQEQKAYVSEEESKKRKEAIGVFDYALNVLSGVNSEEDLEIAKRTLEARHPGTSEIITKVLPSYDPNGVEMIRNSLRTETQRLKGEELKGFSPGTTIYQGDKRIERTPFKPDKDLKPEFELFTDKSGNQGYVKKGDKVPPGFTRVGDDKTKGYELFMDKEGKQSWVEKGKTIPDGSTKVFKPSSDPKAVYDLFEDKDGVQSWMEKGEDIPAGLKKVKAASSSVTVNIPKAAPAGERESLNKLFEFDNQLTRITELYDSEFVGRVEGPLGQVQEFSGLGVKDNATEFRQVTNDISDTLLRLRSGAQINEQEYQRLRKLVPTMNLPDKVFSDKLKSLQKAIKNSIKVRQSSMKQSNFIAPNNTGTNVTIKFDAQGNVVE